MKYDSLKGKKNLKWRFWIENVIITLAFGAVMYAIWTLFHFVFE